MINTRETYLDSGRRYGRFMRNRDHVAAKSEWEWFRRAVKLESPPDQPIASALHEQGRLESNPPAPPVYFS